MNDEISNGNSAEDIAREVHVELLLTVSSTITHGELKEMDNEGEDISTDDNIAKIIGTNLENDDQQVLDLLQDQGFILSKCTVNISMPEKD